MDTGELLVRLFFFQACFLLGDVRQRKRVVIRSGSNHFLFLFYQIGQAYGKRIVMIMIVMVVIVFSENNGANEGRFSLVEGREKHSEFGRQRLIGNQLDFSRLVCHGELGRTRAPGLILPAAISARAMVSGCGNHLHQRRSALSELLCAFGGKVASANLPYSKSLRMSGEGSITVWGRVANFIEYLASVI